MEKPAIPDYESQRLMELLHYHILDTPPDQEFDDIVDLAATICDAPIAFISLVDLNRQWFKSCKGLSVSETPREISFCGHAILGTEVFVVTDALKDPRFSDNPFVTGDPYVRFYAGAPLVSSKGQNVGTLCVIDQKPRELSSAQISSLEKLAKQVVMNMELKRTLEEKNALLKDFQALSKIVLEQKESLRYLEKLEVLKEMAQGLCHEINNPLSVVILAAGSVKHTLSSRGNEFLPELGKIDRIIANGARIEKIVKGLKLYSCMEQATKEEVNLCSIVDDALTLCHELFKERGIQVLIEGQCHRNILCNHGQILQVIHHLLKNASDAVENLPEKWIKIQVEEESRFLSLRVIDSGYGIERSVQEKMMRPFFTTKEIGKGIGLGLSICRGIVQEHGAVLNYENFNGHTSFVIHFPIVKVNQVQLH